MAGLRFSEIQTRSTEVVDLTSLTVDEFRQLVPPFEAAFQVYMAHWRFDGQPRTARRYTTYKNCPLPTPEDRLLLLLVYLKTHARQVVHGRLFGLPPPGPCRSWPSVSGWPRRKLRRWSCRSLSRRPRPIRLHRHPPPPLWPRWHRTADRASPGPG